MFKNDQSIIRQFSKVSYKINTHYYMCHNKQTLVFLCIRELSYFYTALCEAPVAPENGQIICEDDLLLEGVSCKSVCNEG